jgi:hypothetical protein
MADNGLRLFGMEIKRISKDKPKDKLQSIVPASDEDGAGYVTAFGSHYGQYVDLDGSNSKDNFQLIMKYRGVAVHPEVDAALEDIVNESIVANDEDDPVSVILDDIDAPDKIKKQITEEFDNILGLLKFSENGHDIFRRWYIDGRIYHHLVVDPANEKAGIQDIRFIDALKMRKVKEVKKKKDNLTNADVIEEVKEYYIYQDSPGQQKNSVKFTPDSVSYVTSGLLDETRKKVVSHLHKVIKPVNQLRMMEDSLVIYRLARAPERRIFYIDVGNLPKGKAEEYMKNIMTKYRNKLVYDASTGELRDDRKHMSMLEDFWLPRREGGRGTEISTLPGGENLGQIDDIVYFQKRLYRSLNVPLNRLEQESQFSLGRASETTRDELKFQKFIERLRKKFSYLFIEILKKQLLIKKIITENDWKQWENSIKVSYSRDNYFAELKDAELKRERMQTLEIMVPYVGTYFSQEYILKNVLKYDDKDIEDLKVQMKKEIDEAPPPTDED